MVRLSRLEHHMAAATLLSNPTVCPSSYVSDLPDVLTSQPLRIRAAQSFVSNAFMQAPSNTGIQRYVAMRPKVHQRRWHCMGIYVERHSMEDQQSIRSQQLSYLLGAYICKIFLSPTPTVKEQLQPGKAPPPALTLEGREACWIDK